MRKNSNKIASFRDGGLTKQFKLQYNKVEVVDSNPVAAVDSTGLLALVVDLTDPPVVVLTKVASGADLFPAKKQNIVSTILSGFRK